MSMSYTIEEQKRMIVDAVLDLKQEVDALNYLLGESDKPENKVARDIYNDMLWFIHGLLWNSIVLAVCWLYDQDGQRGLCWYLREIKNSDPLSADKADEHIRMLDDLQDQVKKIRDIRDKWVAHRDKKPYEKPKEFWANKPTLVEVETLVDALEGIVHHYFPVIRVSSTGLSRIFGVIEAMRREDPNLVYKLRKYGLLDYSTDY